MSEQRYADFDGPKYLQFDKVLGLWVCGLGTNVSPPKKPWESEAYYDPGCGIPLGISVDAVGQSEHDAVERAFVALDAKAAEVRRKLEGLGQV